ncbi:MAG: CocE/NonD family hydrolase [Candidatus Heimdallarchaeaceae archaeon]
MKTKIIALLISSLIVVTTITTLLIVFLPSRNQKPGGFNWTIPENSTQTASYFKVPYMVPMNDGIRLATDVYVPLDINESLPVILIRTPYDKNEMELFSFYTQENFIVVIQDFRGFYYSEGEIGLPFFTEQKDGQDTIKWITKQPWCNGKIGTWGPSALGIAQYLLAPNAPESLKCQMPIVATPDIYKAMFRNGEFRRELAVPWMESNNFPEESLQYIIEHEKLDKFWNIGRIVNNYSDIHMASLHMGGWYDIFTQETIDAYFGYQNFGGEGARGNAKLVMGPWVHTGMFGSPTGEVTFPNQNLGNTLFVTDALFYKWLKDNSTLWDQLPTVTYYLMSSLEENPQHLANRWYQASSWPLNNIPRVYYLHQNASLLLSSSSSSDGQLSFVYNPNYPVETLGGGNLNIQAGIYNQYSIEQRDDVLSFTTPILEEPITIVGQVNVTLFVESNCTDTDFTVKITDVLPDNTSIIVTDTIIRARNRQSLSSWEFMVPGEVYELSFAMDSTAYLFNQGHRLRIDISSSNYPRFETNPNTGDALWENQTTYVANNTIHLSSTYQTRISLPTVEYNTLQEYSFGVLPSILKSVPIRTKPIKNIQINEATSYALFFSIFVESKKGKKFKFPQLVSLKD